MMDDQLQRRRSRLAERVRDGMFANDRAATALGMHVTAIAPGHATRRDDRARTTCSTATTSATAA